MCDDLVKYKFTEFIKVRNMAKKVISGQETVEIRKYKIVPTCSKCFTKCYNI